MVHDIDYCPPVGDFLSSNLPVTSNKTYIQCWQT